MRDEAFTELDGVTPEEGADAVGVLGRGVLLCVVTAVMFALGVLAMFLLFCEPADDSPHWLAMLILSKIGAVMSGFLTWLCWRVIEYLGENL